MIINRQARVGIIEKKKDFNDEGLFMYDFATSQKVYLQEYAD